jgi:dihydropteroate synthase
MIYVRPIAMTDAARPTGALLLAGGWCWFDRVEILERGRSPRIGDLADLTPDQRRALCGPRADFGGLAMTKPRIMGILNVTPDSFSDGGQFLAKDAALGQALALADAADILDIGGESTRPGAVDVASAEEIARTVPVIAALRATGVHAVISIDTRKADVAAAALCAGANIVNDVAALRYDPEMAAVVANSGAPVILMHAQGAPSDMQIDPRYMNVALDVYDFLAERIRFAVAAGIARDCIIIDPGIGFGKTESHNLALIRQLSLFHGLGCPILLGASRKRFIGTISGANDPQARMPGSLAVALSGVAQGAQILRVHDVVETRQALALWHAVNVGDVA